MLGSRMEGRVNPGTRALIAATQCNSAITTQSDLLYPDAVFHINR
jgi:hypothetical protein